MPIEYWFDVEEHYGENDPPEVFGHVRLDHVPKVGEVVQLRWLDGKPAYEVSVIRVDERAQRLDVRKVVAPMEDLKQVIVAACDRAVRGGRVIWPGSYGVRFSAGAWVEYDGRRCCCPMGAVLMTAEDPSGLAESKSLAAADVLGVDSNWVRWFTIGFDSFQEEFTSEEFSDPLVRAGFELGVELRQRYCP